VVAVSKMAAKEFGDFKPKNGDGKSNADSSGARGFPLGNPKGGRRGDRQTQRAKAFEDDVNSDGSHPAGEWPWNKVGF
jgi:hypothetical protein